MRKIYSLLLVTALFVAIDVGAAPDIGKNQKADDIVLLGSDIEFNIMNFDFNAVQPMVVTVSKFGFMVENNLPEFDFIKTKAANTSDKATNATGLFYRFYYYRVKDLLHDYSYLKSTQYYYYSTKTLYASNKGPSIRRLIRA